MAKDAKVNYDEGNDILYVYTGEKAKDSLEIDNFVIDISASNKIVGVEIFNASTLFSKLSNIEIDKEALASLRKASIKFYRGKQLLYVVVVLPIKIKGREKDISLPIPTPIATAIKA